MSVTITITKLPANPSPAFAENILEFTGTQEQYPLIITIEGQQHSFTVWLVNGKGKVNLTKIFRTCFTSLSDDFNYLSNRTEALKTATLQLDNQTLTINLLPANVQAWEQYITSYPTLSYFDLRKKDIYGYPYDYPVSYGQEEYEHYTIYEGLPFDISILDGSNRKRILPSGIKKEQLPCHHVYIKWLNSIGGWSYEAFEIIKEESSTKRKYFQDFQDNPQKENQISLFKTYDKSKEHIYNSLLISRKIYLYKNDEFLEVGIKNAKNTLENQTNVKVKFTITYPEYYV